MLFLREFIDIRLQKISFIERGVNCAIKIVTDPQKAHNINI